MNERRAPRASAVVALQNQVPNSTTTSHSDASCRSVGKCSLISDSSAHRRAYRSSSARLTDGLPVKKRQRRRTLGARRRMTPRSSVIAFIIVRDHWEMVKRGNSNQDGAMWARSFAAEDVESGG